MRNEDMVITSDFNQGKNTMKMKELKILLWNVVENEEAGKELMDELKNSTSFSTQKKRDGAIIHGTPMLMVIKYASTSIHHQMIVKSHEVNQLLSKA